jgi:pyruvate-formate lyase-activating enzyme
LLTLAEILSLRPVPAAAVFLALTRRCPLSCAHCSTNSTPVSEQSPAEMFERFVDSFSHGNRPELLAITGGEAFLRPALVRTLAERAGEVGCRTMALSGMFWARGGRIPPAIRRAIDVLDHFSVSLDVFHEREVARVDVFRILDELLTDGKDVSIHLVGLNAEDPYLVSTIEDVRRTFDDRVPMLVNGVNAVGRAAEWMAEPVIESVSPVDAVPCTMAAWPTVAFDGTIVACCNNDVVNGPAPAHLTLGHADTDTWADVSLRCREAPMLRALRTFGPEFIAAHHASETGACDGYCSTCVRLSHDTLLVNRVQGKSSALPPLEQHIVELQQDSGPASFARRYAIARYADLVTLGGPS